MLKLSLLFKKFENGQITQESLGLKIRNFQGIVFVWTQTYRQIFKSVLVYLYVNALYEMSNIQKTCAFNIEALTKCVMQESSFGSLISEKFQRNAIFKVIIIHSVEPAGRSGLEDLKNVFKIICFLGAIIRSKGRGKIEGKNLSYFTPTLKME